MKRTKHFLTYILLLLITTLSTLAIAEEKIANVSWYGSYHHGKKMANGQVFDQNRISVAHKSLPFGTKVKMTCTSSGKSVVATVTDRGPYVKNRQFDLSRAAFAAISPLGKGVTQVKYEILD